MGSFGTIGDVNARFIADTKTFDANVESSTGKLAQAGKMAEEAAGKIEAAGQRTDNAGRAMERALDRARAAWQREKLAQDQAIDREQAGARAKELAALRADILSRSEEGLATSIGMATAAQRMQNEALEAGVPQYAATSAAVRLMEGNLNNMVRAAERFVGQSAVLSRITALAFPVVGAIALADLLVRMGKEAWDVTQNFFELKNAIEAISQAEIDVARNNEQMQKTIESNVENILSKTAGEPTALRQRLKFQSQQPLDMSSYFYSGMFKKLPDDVKANYETLYKSVAPEDIPERLASINKEVADLQSAANFNPGFGMYVKSVNGYGPGERDPQAYYKARLAVARQIQSQLQGETDVRASGLQSLSADIASADQSTANKGGRSQMEAWRQQLEEQKAQHTMSPADEEAFWQKRADSAKKGSALYAAALNEANKARGEELKQQQADVFSSLMRNSEDHERAQAFTDRVADSLYETWHAAEERDKTANAEILESAKRGFEAAQQQQKAADELAEQRIAMGLASGRISHADAVQQLAGIHARSYANYLDAAGDFSKQFPNEAVPGAAQSMREYGLQAQNDQAALENPIKRGMDLWVASAQDAAQQISQILLDAINEFNGSLSHSLMAHAYNGQEYRRGIVEGLSNTSRGIGSQLLDSGFKQIEGSALGKFGFGPKTKPDGSQSNPFWTRTVDGKIAGVSAGNDFLSGINSGPMARARNSILAMNLPSFLPPSSPTGGASSDWSSFFANANGALPNGVDLGDGGAGAGSVSVTKPAQNGWGNFTQSLVGSALKLLPFMADGGSISSNMPAIVGEAGPELFVPASSGRIVPNNELGGNSTQHHTWNIDARGSTDPAQVEASVHRAMKQWAPRVVAASTNAVRENRLRKPPSARG